MALLAAACGERAPEAPPAGTNPDASRSVAPATPDVEAIRIVVLGDSLSAGMGLPESEAFPALVEERLRDEGFPVEVINAGVSGDTSAGGLSRLDWVLRSGPDILVVELGANDALRGQPLENTERNLREILRRGREAGATPVLLGMDVPTSYGPDYTGGFRAIYERLAREEEVRLVPDFIREVGLDPKLMQADGLHPTAEGHRRLAGLLLPHLREMLAGLPGAHRSGTSDMGPSARIGASRARIGPFIQVGLLIR